MKLSGCIFLFLSAALLACTDSSGTKGSLTISITDAPADADNIKGVNLFIANIEGKRGSDWKSLRYFDQPIGVNLLDYSGGKSLVLIEQFLDPGTFSEVRFRFNLADLNSSLMRSPQCNVELVDGTTKPIYYFDAGKTELMVTQEFRVAARGHTDITFDFDVRKSLIQDELGNYVLKPFVRMIETGKAGHVAAVVSNHNPTDRIVVFAYSAGQFSLAETNAPAPGEVRFKNAITSARMKEARFGLGFLPAGTYDLIFIKNSESGEFQSVFGRQNGIAVTANETVPLDIDLNQVGGS
jgi:hypothetical protein